MARPRQNDITNSSRIDIRGIDPHASMAFYVMTRRTDRTQAAIFEEAIELLVRTKMAAGSKSATNAYHVAYAKKDKKNAASRSDLTAEAAASEAQVGGSPSPGA